MPSTYTTNNGIEKIATGEQSGTWGDTTNVNFDLLDEALDGQVSIALTGTGTSGSPNDVEITDGTSSNGRNRFVEFTGTPGGDTYVRLTPNDAEKVLFIQNSTNQTLLLFQGTYASARDYQLKAGRNAVIRFTGGGTTSYAYNALEDLKVSTLETDILSVSDDSTGEVAITSTSVPTLLRVQSNDDGAGDGPRLDLYRNSSSPADDDNLGQIYFSGEDDGGGKHQYAKIEAFIKDATAGAEEGRLAFNVLANGSGSQMLTLRGDTGGTDGEVVINEAGNEVNFRIEGSSESDLFVTDAANDKIIIGHDTPQNIGGSQAALQITGLDAATATMSITRHQASASGPQLRFAKSRVSTKNDTTIVQSGDDLGAINFYGADGTDLGSLAAQILAEVDGTPGVDDMPGRIRFLTTADGANSPTEHMRIDSSGNIGINETDPGSLLHITSSSTTNTAMFQLECTDGGASTGPDVYLFRNSPSPADNDYIGSIHFAGKNSADETITYATHYAKITDVTDGTEDSRQEFYIRTGGSLVNAFHIGATEVVVNQDSQDINFRVESAGNANAFFVDAGTDFIGMHTGTAAALSGYTERVRIASDGNNLGGSLVMSANNGGRTGDNAENDIVFYDTDSVLVNNQNSGSIRWYGLDASGPGAGFKAGIRGHARSNGALYLEFYAASSTTNYQKTATLSAGGFTPGSDNTMDLGGATARWDDIYATNNVINTSDERLKQQVASLTTDEINAAKAISALFKTYKWNDKVAEKGDNARIHSGVIAQQVKSAMEDNDLDPTKYAFFCWNEYYEIEMSGEDIATPYMETFEVGDPDIPEGATYVDRYSIRYGELMSFIHAATEQRLASIESRLDALESA